MKRPLSLTVIGWLFIAIGIGSLARHLGPLVLGQASAPPPNEGDAAVAWVVASGFVAIAGGVLLLRRVVCARWMLAAWLAFHIWVGWLHDPVRLAFHAALFVVVVFLLFRPAASAWLRATDGTGDPPDAC
ncbi:MAG TPA: hypothetical protein VFY71_14210 [Planctomycetota bacterium]|nr:hypothetical protein [Planctomycetota bacterium]